MEQDQTSSGAAQDQAAPEPAGAEADVAALRRELEQSQAVAQRYLANWQRAQADLSNFRRQSEQAREELVKFAAAGVGLDLLSILDDLERALTTVPPNLLGFTWISGIYLVFRRLQAVLEAHGITEIEAQGKAFDPARHQAVMEVEGPPGVVADVLQRGYMLKDRVLRPTMVTVGKASGPPATESQASQARTGEAPSPHQPPLQEPPSPGTGPV
ncbi:MAG: nucleotide exchange factor GrpE [Chloroflexi bacterium]|nr:nucleotide exchange factor GrpE [Chloroflexota bacterium]